MINERYITTEEQSNNFFSLHLDNQGMILLYDWCGEYVPVSSLDITQQVDNFSYVTFSIEGDDLFSVNTEDKRFLNYKDQPFRKLCNWSTSTVSGKVLWEITLEFYLSSEDCLDDNCNFKKWV